MDQVVQWVIQALVGKAVIGGLVGAMVAWLVARWHRHRELAKLGHGKWDTTCRFLQVTLHDIADGIVRMQVRTIGNLPLHTFFGSKDAKTLLIREAEATKRTESVVPMPGYLGSYVLGELEGMLRHCPMDGDVTEEYAMIPLYQTFHGLSTCSPEVVLVRPSDLARFTSFDQVKDFQVRFSDWGAVILSLIEAQSKFATQSANYLRVKEAGGKTTWLEHMWVVPANLSTELMEPKAEYVKQGITRPWKRVTWTRFAQDLDELGLQA